MGAEGSKRGSLSERVCKIAMSMGVLLLFISFLLYGALELTTSWEQARTPGERNLGVAVLGMIFGFPMLLTSVSAIACLIVGIIAWIYRRFYRGKSKPS